METPSSQELLGRYVSGDSRAAAELFDRYVARLIALARERISPRLRRRVDPEDVVQSAYRSFFASARQERYVLSRAGDLWRLLAAITLHKLHRQVDRHTAARRDIGREAAADRPLPLPENLIAGDPTPDEVAAVIEQLHLAMERLTPIERQVLEQRLQGASIEEIAEELGRSQRTVRRVLEKVRNDFSRHSR